MSSNTKTPNVLIVCRYPDKHVRVSSYLNSNGYKCKVVGTIKSAISNILNEKPNHILISWNLNPNPRKFIKSLNATFSISCIPFAESGERNIVTQISKSGFKDIILYPMSGESVRRVLDRREGKTQKSKSTLALSPEKQNNVSRIQIRISAEDVPSNGIWEEIPGRTGVWFFNTEEKLKFSTNKNGRFVYQGERCPIKKAGTWDIDTKRGKLDFEIFNIVNEDKFEPIQKNLTEEEAFKKISQSLGMSIEELEKEAKKIDDTFFEESIYQDETTKDLVLPEDAEVDSIIQEVAEDLERGFLDEDRARLNDSEDSNGDLIYEDRTMDENGNYYDEHQGTKEEGGSIVMKGEATQGGAKLVKGEQAKSGVEIFEGNKTGGSHFLKGEREESDLNHIQGEKKNKIKKSGFEEERDPSSTTSRENTDEINDPMQRQQEEYKSHLDGTKDLFAETVHGLNLQFGNTIDRYPELVNEVSHVGIIKIKTNKIDGYLVAATGNNRSTNLERFDLLKEQLKTKLKDSGHVFFDFHSTFIQTETFQYLNWIQQNARFSSFVQVSLQEVCISFLMNESAYEDIKQSHTENMMTIPTENIAPGVAVTFDLYLYLIKNEKFILYIRKQNMLTETQYNNLKNRNQDKCFVHKEQIDEYKKYVARNYILQRIEMSKKLNKAS